MKEKYFNRFCDYSFKEGDFVICKQNSGFSHDLILGKKYKVITSTYVKFGANQIDIIGENGFLSGLFASRFTTVKIERKNKLININKIKDEN
jgi:hypothetical protein